jgi:heat shock protein HslJ
MNDQQLSRYFDELAETIDSRPPSTELLALGRTAVRRRQRRTVAASVAAVALILGGGAAVQQLMGNEGEKPKPPPDQVADPPVAPDGMRFAGMGRVVVTVPESWGSDHVCAPDVIAPAMGCAQGEETTWTLSFFKLKDRYNLEIEGPDESSHNGVDIIEGPAACPPTASCVGPMPYVVRVPSEGIGFILGGGPGADRRLQTAIVESVGLLPAGFTTVPYLQPGLMASEAEEVVRAAGLEPQLDAPDVNVPIAGTGPPAGSVVQVPSTVTLLTQVTGPPVEGRWTALLTGITADGRLDDLHRDTTFTLTFADGELRGDDECNQFGADYKQLGRELRFGPIDSTAIGCETTDAIVRVLNDVRHVTGNQNRLHLHADHWGIVLSLQPASVEPRRG